MPKILAIETTGQLCSVAIFQDSKIIGSYQDSESNVHSAVLHTLIKKLAFRCAIDLSELNAIALSSGPGSYTGLRIGSSSAKGLCLALDIPLISIPTHYCMLYDEMVIKKDSHLPKMCLTDARRTDVFISTFTSNNMVKETTRVLNLEEVESQNELNKTPFLVLGSGAKKAKQFLGNEHTYLENDCLLAENLLVPSIARFEKESFADLVSFEPRYEKEFYSPSFNNPKK